MAGEHEGSTGVYKGVFGHLAGIFLTLLSLEHMFAQDMISLVSKREEMLAGLGRTPDLYLRASPAHPGPATAIIS